MFALSKFTNVLTSAVEAAFAPETSLYEDFQYHWRAIMNYYIENNDEKTPINMTNIPNHLSQMLQILIQEEAEIKSIEAGPCMEYLLQQKILETLQTLGRGDTPPGMKQHTLIFFTTLLGRIRQPLLPHVAVFQPVLKLIKLCGQVQAAPTENEEINFLCIVCAKLKEKSHLVNFFIQDEQLENERKMQKAKMEAKAAENVLKGVEQDQQKALLAQKMVKLQDSGTISIENSQHSNIENSLSNSLQNSQITSSQDSSNNFSESQRIATPASSVNQNEQESEISNSSIIKDPEVVATASQVSSFRTDNSSVGSMSSNSKYRSVSGGGSVANTSTDNSRTTSQEIGQEPFPMASDQAMGGTNSQLSDISEKSGSARADDSDGGNSEHLTKSGKTNDSYNSNLTSSRHTSSLTSSSQPGNSLAATQDTKSNLKNSTINSSENSSSTANQNQSQAITTSNYSESQHQETFSSSAISYSAFK